MTFFAYQCNVVLVDEMKKYFMVVIILLQIKYSCHIFYISCRVSPLRAPQAEEESADTNSNASETEEREKSETCQDDDSTADEFSNLDISIHTVDEDS